MKPIVIFGAGEIAEVVAFYLRSDAGREVAAFTVDRAFINEQTFCGKPVIPFDEITESCPPDRCEMMVAMGYSGVNRVRTEKFLAAKAAGYFCGSYISSQACVAGNVRMGENCLIFEHNTVQPFSVIGDNVTLWSGNHVGHHVSIGNHCFIASHVVISGGVSIGEACFIGVNATIRDHVRVGARCVIGAGALLLSDAEPEGVYLGTATERSRVPSSRLRKI